MAVCVYLRTAILDGDLVVSVGIFGRNQAIHRVLDIDDELPWAVVRKCVWGGG